MATCYQFATHRAKDGPFRAIGSNFEEGLLRAHQVGNLRVLLIEKRSRRGVLEGRFLDEAPDFLRHKFGALEDRVFLVRTGSPAKSGGQ